MDQNSIGKSRVWEKYHSKFIKSSNNLVLKKYFGCPKLGENRTTLKTHSYLPFQKRFLTQKKS